MSGEPAGTHVQQTQPTWVQYVRANENIVQSTVQQSRFPTVQYLPMYCTGCKNTGSSSVTRARCPAPVNEPFVTAESAGSSGARNT